MNIVDQRFIGYLELDLETLRVEMHQLAGDWNGDDEHGAAKAVLASQIIETATQLKRLLEELGSV